MNECNMNKIDFSKIPLERKMRLLHRIKNFGKVCIDCGESLTASDKAAGKKWCAVCEKLFADGGEYSYKD